MRYLVHPLFWDALKDAGVSDVALGERTQTARNYAYRLRAHPQRTVTGEWMEEALTFFPAEERPGIRRLLFTPALGRERYQIRVDLWGRMTICGLNYARLARAIDVKTQRMYNLRRHPHYTIDSTIRSALAAALSIPTNEYDRYFTLAPDRGASDTGPSALAS